MAMGVTQRLRAPPDTCRVSQIGVRRGTGLRRVEIPPALRYDPAPDSPTPPSSCGSPRAPPITTRAGQSLENSTIRRIRPADLAADRAHPTPTWNSDPTR